MGSADIGVLAPELKKSTIEPRPNLLRCKSIVNIRIFNVRTLKIIHQLPDLIAYAAEHNIDIICVQEHRYYHSERKLKYYGTGNGWAFVSAYAWIPPSSVV